MLDCDVACSKVASWHFVGTRDLMVRRLYSINQTTHRVIVVVSVCYVYFVAATRFASNSLLLLSGQGNIGGVVGWRKMTPSVPIGIAGDGCARSLVWPITTVCQHGKCINNTCICDNGYNGLGELQDRRGYDCNTNVCRPYMPYHCCMRVACLLLTGLVIDCCSECSAYNLPNCCGNSSVSCHMGIASNIHACNSYQTNQY
jgi:hypothetical protein